MASTGLKTRNSARAPRMSNVRGSDDDSLTSMCDVDFFVEPSDTSVGRRHGERMCNKNG